MTQRQIKFAQTYVETGNASEAYRRHYAVDKMKEATIGRRAFDVLHNPKVQQLIEELREKHRKKHEVTVESITEELNEAIKLARGHSEIDPKALSALIQAIMGKAKLHGLLIDRNKLEVPEGVEFRMFMGGKANDQDG